jgi:hypothetical protein
LLRGRIADEAAGDVFSSTSGLDADAIAILANPAAVRAELGRIEASLPSDPGTAIGKAKNLIEATAKAVLTDVGHPYSEKDDINKHVHASMQALGIDYKTMVGHDAEIAKVMQRLNGLTIELANLRNRAGDGHGMSTPPAGLQLRHGRLAVRAAIAWCAFMLDSLHDQAVGERQPT